MSGDIFGDLDWKGGGRHVAPSGSRLGPSAPSLLSSQHLGGHLGHSGRSVNGVTVFALKYQQCDKDWGGNVGNFSTPCAEEAFVT